MTGARMWVGTLDDRDSAEGDQSELGQQRAHRNDESDGPVEHHGLDKILVAEWSIPHANLKQYNWLAVCLQRKKGIMSKVLV